MQAVDYAVSSTTSQLNVKTIIKDTYVCSKHFRDGKPTLEYQIPSGLSCVLLRKDTDPHPKEEIGHERHKYNNSCVFIVMKASPEKPVMTPVPAEVDAGLTINVSCSVAHTCASHPPVFSWSVPNITSKVQSTMTTPGVWETTSTITFIAAGGDGVMSLTCTAVLLLEKATSQHRSSSWPLIATVSAISLILIIIAAVIGVVFYKRRRRPDNSLTPPPSPEKRRSLWDRVSRRNRENRERPPRPEKRGSIWRRCSQNQGNKANLSVGYSNNSDYVSWNHKQRCPSPKTLTIRMPTVESFKTSRI
ncbi:uncharacterized protein LOC117553911 [Gymnodraco acuticeps]|uniref:Uncharacterized protein LOC117553911 n=1 Tax=Gymnodraco acuticeps TaxID=8218 RepID=A0A6P8V2U6_GYMAC|nr:uncharacterized protein LOC117553911 [Gymnodraco acuticeps]